jgi:hypothetical protein
LVHFFFLSLSFSLYFFFFLPEENSGSSSKDTRNTKEMPITCGVWRNIRIIVGSVHVTTKSKDEDEDNNQFDSNDNDVECRRLTNTIIERISNDKSIDLVQCLTQQSE